MLALPPNDCNPDITSSDRCEAITFEVLNTMSGGVAVFTTELKGVQESYVHGYTRPLTLT